MIATSGAPGAPLLGRALLLFGNFLGVILAYYQVKTASRSLLLEHAGAASFPYVWVGSALVLLLFIGAYNRLVEHVPRAHVVMASLIGFALLLVLFHWRLEQGGLVTVVAFYIFVDIFSVVLVEQFWSLANNVMRLEEGRRSYWFVASGGLVGGILGSATAAALLRYTALTTEDLLLSCAVLLVLTAAFNAVMMRHALFADARDDVQVELQGAGLRAVLGNRYLLLVALVVCLSQLAEPVVEFQFMRSIEFAYPDKDERTRYIADFFTVLGLVAIGVNVVLTPLVHRHLGIMAGLAVQPLLLMTAAGSYVFHQGLVMAGVMKVTDRGLSYSINRASKELLYVPVDPLLTFQAKAWIDMLGYRLFKVLGSGLIVLLTAVVPAGTLGGDLAWATMAICLAWLAAVGALARVQRRALVAVPA